MTEFQWVSFSLLPLLEEYSLTLLLLLCIHIVIAIIKQI